MNIALNGQIKHGDINKGKEIREKYYKLQGLQVLYEGWSVYSVNRNWQWAYYYSETSIKQTPH